MEFKELDKVFINDKALLFTDNSELELRNKMLGYESRDSVVKAVELLEQGYVQELYLFAHDTGAAQRAFMELFEPIEAAGGVVRNRKNQVLFIFRHGKWDLPKGKIETGEDSQDAAMREVEEECGISGLALRRELRPTFHTYTLNGRRMLKKTHWYEMSYSGSPSAVKPQTEESITEVKWLSSVKIQKALTNTYNSIREVMTAAENL
jgi:8-oxo-dGTP pyrophosphatase MutT (NUDIX family)